MALSINTNLASQTAQQSQSRTQTDVASAIDRLSSGLRINSAKDDAAGLAIASRFTTQIRGTTQAIRNANNAISLTQTADGALGSIDDDPQRVRELAVQSANASLSSSDRASLQVEVSALKSEIDRVATQAQFNGVDLLDGSFTSQAFQVGANAGQTITVASIGSARADTIGLPNFGFDVSRQTFAPPQGPPATAPLTVTIGSGTALDLGSVALDAQAEAVAINGSGIAGLSASVNATESRGGVSSAVAFSGSGVGILQLNGQAISLPGQPGSSNLASNRAAAIAAINAVTASTGVVASDNGNGLDLVAADGRNIETVYFAGSFLTSSAYDFGIPNILGVGGSINLHYRGPTTVPNNVEIDHGSGPASYAVGMVDRLDSVDISTAGGGVAALGIVDAALASVTSTRASLGAVQNRFSSTIDNLQTSNANLDASRSRIVDADFATETAKLARGQVLQQASAAMIAQANQTPSLVLALLRA